MSAPETGVTAETVKKIARLSRLHVEDDRLSPLADELNGILGWIEQLNEVDVDGVEPMTSAVDVQAPMRSDQSFSTFSRQPSKYLKELLFCHPHPHTRTPVGLFLR